MTYRPLFKPQFGEIIPAEWYWDVVDDITYLYAKSVQLEQQLDCVEAYLQTTNQLLSNIESSVDNIENNVEQLLNGQELSNYYLNLIYSETEKIEETLKNVQEEASLSNKYLSLLDTEIVTLNKNVQNIQSALKLTNYYIVFLAPARSIKTIEKIVTAVPEPLFVDQLTVKRVIIKADRTNLYTIFIGNSSGQYFPLLAGEQLELNVSNVADIYLRSEGQSKVFALFEIV